MLAQGQKTHEIERWVAKLALAVENRERRGFLKEAEHLLQPRELGERQADQPVGLGLVGMVEQNLRRCAERRAAPASQGTSPAAAASAVRVVAAPKAALAAAMVRKRRRVINRDIMVCSLVGGRRPRLRPIRQWECERPCTAITFG